MPHLDVKEWLALLVLLLNALLSFLGQRQSRSNGHELQALQRLQRELNSSASKDTR